MIKSFLIGLLFLVACKCPADEVSWHSEGMNGFSASASFSKDTLSLLDELVVELKLTYPTSYHPNIEDIRAHLFQNIGIDAAPFTSESEQASVSSQLKSGLLTQTLTFHLVPQITGTHALTFLGIPFEPNESNENKQVIIMSGIAAINVTSPLVELNSITYEPPLLSLSSSFPIDMNPTNKASLLLKTSHEAARNVILLNAKSIPWVSIGLLILAISFAVLFIKTKENVNKPPSQILSPKTKAYNELKKIKHQNGSQLYLNLTTVLSHFLEEQYKIPATSSASQELLAKIACLPLSTQTLTLLGEFLNTADQIKFGLVEASTEQSLKDFQLIQDLISNA